MNDHRERDGMPASVWAVIGVLAVVVVIGLVFLLRWILAPASGALQEREKTVGNGDYRIAQYDHFFNLCAATQTTQQNLADAEKAAAAKDVDQTRQAQLDANVTATRQTFHELVNQYNADARKADTAAHFRASDLPAQLDSDETLEITCHA